MRNILVGSLLLLISSSAVLANEEAEVNLRAIQNEDGYTISIDGNNVCRVLTADLDKVETTQRFSCDDNYEIVAVQNPESTTIITVQVGGFGVLAKTKVKRKDQQDDGKQKKKSDTVTKKTTTTTTTTASATTKPKAPKPAQSSSSGSSYQRYDPDPYMTGVPGRHRD